MTAGSYDFIASSDMDGFAGIVDMIAAALHEFEADEKSRHNISVAVDEIVSNIIKFAYGDKKGKIWVSCSRMSDTITIMIQDEGLPFDPTAAPEPDISPDLDERIIGGLGIFLVKKLMDTVTYERKDGRNIVTLKKSMDNIHT